MSRFCATTSRKSFEELDLFVFELIEEEEWTITEKRWEKVRDQLVANMTNFGFPPASRRWRLQRQSRALSKAPLRRHRAEMRYGRKALEHVYTLWAGLHLETVIDEEPTVLHYNGDEHGED